MFYVCPNPGIGRGYFFGLRGKRRKKREKRILFFLFFLLSPLICWFLQAVIANMKAQTQVRLPFFRCTRLKFHLKVLEYFPKPCINAGGASLTAHCIYECQTVVVCFHWHRQAEMANVEKGTCLNNIRICYQKNRRAD